VGYILVKIIVDAEMNFRTVTAVMIFATIFFVGLSFLVPRQKRIFYYITAAITMIASIAYFTMGSNLGHAAVPVEFVRSRAVVSGSSREIFYVRYIDWVITTPVISPISPS
jgi:bacteriorhodopsin